MSFHSMHFLPMFLLARANTGCWALVKYVCKLKEYIIHREIDNLLCVRCNQVQPNSINSEQSTLIEAKANDAN